MIRRIINTLRRHTLKAQLQDLRAYVLDLAHDLSKLKAAHTATRSSQDQLRGWIADVATKRRSDYEECERKFSIIKDWSERLRGV